MGNTNNCCCCDGDGDGNGGSGSRTRTTAPAAAESSSRNRTRDLCCNRKITWPICIGLFHVCIYLTVIVLNGLNLVEAILTLSSAPSSVQVNSEEGRNSGEREELNEDNQSKRKKKGGIHFNFNSLNHHHRNRNLNHDPGEDPSNLNESSTDLSSELMIVHSICIIILASVGFCISFNLLLLKGSKLEIARSLKLWLVYTVLFCLLIVPYYVWRLSTSEHVGRWLIQLVATNSVEGYFLGIAYSLITELTADPSQQMLMGRGSSKFHALQSRESQITFVGEVTNLKTFTEIKI